MRAAVFHENGGPEVVRVEEVPTPEPGPGEVRVKVLASAMNHLDLWVRRGLPGLPAAFPHVGGSDIAGIVEAVGAGVDGVDGPTVGERVVVDPSLGYGWYDLAALGASPPPPALRLLGEHAWGGFAEYCVAPAANLVTIPDGVPFETAAAGSLASVTAWHGLLGRAGLRPGESVLVTAASGGVGSTAVQIAREAGATVYAVTGGADSVERVRDLGAHAVYDRLAEDPWKALWRDTGKRGVDVALDSVGEATWPSLLRSMAVGGRLVTYGATTGPSGPTSIPLVFWKQLSILGATMGSPAEYREAMRLVFDGRVRPAVHEALPLEGARRAHELLEGGGVFGKLVLTPWS